MTSDPTPQTDSPPSRVNRWEVILLASMLLVIILLRLLYLNDFSKSPFFETPAIDAMEYTRWAEEIRSGELLWDHVSIHSPLYAYFLAGLLWVTGDQLGLARTVQSLLLGIGTCLVVWSIARHSAGRLAAAASAVLIATFWPLVLYNADLLVESLVVLLNGLALLTLIRARGRLSFLALAGVFLGLSAASRPNVLVFVPVVAAWTLWPGARRRRANAANVEHRWRSAISRAAVVCITAAAVISPVLLRNHELTGEWILQANGGLNFYIGNNAEANGTPNVRPGRPWLELITMPVDEEIITLSGQDAFYRDEALDWWEEDPGGAIGLFTKKVLLFWNDYETRSSQDIYYFRKLSPVMSQPWPGFGSLAALALVGVAWALFRRSRNTSLLILYAATYTFATALFVVSGRYRLPAVAGAIPLAGIAVAWACAAFRSGRRWMAIAATVLALHIGLAVRQTPDDVIVRDNASELFNLGTIHMKAGEFDEALRVLREAQREDPYDGRILVNIGTVFLRTGRVAEAMPILRRAVGLFPESADAWNTLGVGAAAIGDDEEAYRAYRMALETDPAAASAHLNLGKLLLNRGDRGDRDSAAEHIATARRLGATLPPWAVAALRSED